MEMSSSSSPPLKLRIRGNETVGEDEANESNASDDSDSDDVPECHIPLKNSSQSKSNEMIFLFSLAKVCNYLFIYLFIYLFFLVLGSVDKNKLNPVVVKMKINGIYYKGVLHPTSNKVKFT